MRDLHVQVDDITTEQKRADADVELVKSRRDRDQAMVDSGEIKDPKALERMLGELKSLHRRINDLEDVEIEVMERLEEAQQSLAQHTVDLAALETENAEVQAAYENRTQDLQAQLSAVQEERRTAASGMPEDLLALYEKLRAQKDGVGAAALAAT